MRQQTVLNADQVDVRKLQTFATVHRDQGDGVALQVLFLLAFAIKRKVLQKGLQAINPFECGVTRSIECLHKVFHVADAIVCSLTVLFGAAQFFDVAGFAEESFGPLR